MHLLYLDESGNPDDPADKHFILAGLSAFEKNTHFLSTEAELGGREFLSAVFFKSKCFQRCTGKVLALCGQVSGDVFGEIKSDPHKAILRASEWRRQPHALGRLR